MTSALLSYPITRRFTWRYFTVTFVFFAVIWLASITIVNVIVVGYEWMPLLGGSASFNNSVELWYEKFIPATLSSGMKPSFVCNQSVIPLNTGISFSCQADFQKDVFTANTGLFPYTLRGFTDSRKIVHTQGMTYANNPINNCSVQILQLSQFLWHPVGDDVNSNSLFTQKC